MRFIAALLLAIHGLIHFVGVRDAIWPPPLRAQRLVSLPRALDGGLWFSIGAVFLGAAVSLWVGNDNWRPLLLAASAGSLLVCLAAWPGARFGLVIDALLLVSTLLLSPSSRASYVGAAFARELEVAAVTTRPVPRELVDEVAVARLPAPVQRYLGFMGVIGRPRDFSLRASFSARFRRDQGDWLPCEAIQYDRRAPVTRVYMMQLSLRHLLPVTVRDEYLQGRGTLRARAFDLLTVAQGSGPELDVGELVTYLNDALLIAPSLVLGKETTWSEVDADTFDVTLADGPTTVTARVHLDARGAPVVFSTTDRFFEMPDGRLVRTEWRTPIAGWQRAAGRSLPTRAQAVWQLPSGPFAYADFTFDPARIAFNTADF